MILQPTLICSIIITQCAYSNITERAVETTKYSTTNTLNVTDIKSEGFSLNSNTQIIIIIGIILIVLFLIIILLLIGVWMYIKKNSSKIKNNLEHRSPIPQVSSMENTIPSINATDNDEDDGDDDIELPKMDTLGQQPGKYGSNHNSPAMPSRHVTPDGYSGVDKFNLDDNKNENEQRENVQSVIPEDEPIMQYNAVDDTPNGITPYQTAEGHNKHDTPGNMIDIPNPNQLGKMDDGKRMRTESDDIYDDEFVKNKGKMHDIKGGDSDDTNDIYDDQVNNGGDGSGTGDDEDYEESTASSDEMYDDPDEMSNNRVLALDNEHPEKIGHVVNSSII